VSEVLLIEDNPHLQLLYQLELMAKGLAVRTAGTLAQAKKELRAHLPGIVIVDLHLPDSAASDTLATVLDVVPSHLPVVVNSAYDRYRTTIPAGRKVVYILKSSDLTELLSAVARLLAERALPACRPAHGGVLTTSRGHWTG